jgi:hypothetical protein
VGNWLDEVGIDVARGKGGGGKWGAGNGPGGGAKKDKADGKAATKRERRGDFRWQPKRPGPFAQLPLRQIMRVLEIVLDARFESQSRGGDAAPSADVEGADVANQKHASTSEEGRRELARAASRIGARRSKGSPRRRSAIKPPPTRWSWTGWRPRRAR